MGNPPKPARLKLLEGNRGHRPIRPEPKPAEIPLEAPETLSEAAHEEWARAVEAAPPGLLTAYDAAVLEVYAGAMAEYRRTAELLARTGPLVAGRRQRPGEHGGAPELVTSPLARIARDQARLVLQSASLLAMAPVARARLAAGADPVQGDDLSWLFTDSGGRPRSG